MSNEEYRSVEQRLEALEQRQAEADEAAQNADDATGAAPGEPDEDLQVSSRRREDQGVVEIGVTLDGAFLPLMALKSGYVDDRVQVAREQAEARQAEQSE